MFMAHQKDIVDINNNDDKNHFRLQCDVSNNRMSI